MKKFTTLLLAIVLVSIGAKAQTYWDPSYFSNCNSGTNVITPVINASPGFYPADSLLPCFTAGQSVHDTLYFTNFSQTGGVNVQSLKFDSIYLPAGLCWSSNKANNTFGPGENGVIYISGTPTASAGRYKLRFIIDLNIGVMLVHQDLEALSHLRYYTRVSCAGGGCSDLDRSDSVHIFVTDTACGSSTLTASITANGATSFCPGGSVTLFANAGSGYSYLWSTGATTRSIAVSSTGSYVVTVYRSTDSAVATPVGVTVLSSCAISATITPGGSTNICAGSSVTLTANSGAGYTYRWSTGATTSSIVATTAGGYVVTVSDGVDSAVSSITTVTINSSCTLGYFDPSYFSSCNSGTSSILPQIGTIPGLSPSDSALPCAPFGQVVYDTIYFKNFTSTAGVPVNSLKFDSIYLPAGLCWQTNKVNNTFGPGEDGVIYIYGTPTAAPGRYKLRMIIDVNIGVLLSNQDAEALAHLRYFMRISCAGAPCPYLNKTDSTSIFVPDTACGVSPLYASITPGGATTFCPGGSVTLTANAGSGYSYRWSTGSTTRSITASSSGSYGVTVYSGADSAVASPVTVTALSSCPISATITASGSTTLCSGSSITLTANSGTGYTYRWSTGATTASIVVSTAGSYRVTVTSGVDTAVSAPTVVTVNTSCSANYWNPAYFSNCNSGTNAITPVVHSSIGFYPPDSLLPCIPAGQVIHDTIYFTNFSQAGGVNVQSLKFDSIYLPAGLCWTSNKANNTFAQGENGVIYISGTPTGPAGRYKLRIIVDINIGVLLANQDLDPLGHIRYFVRVSCSGGTCPAINRADSVSTFVADTACGSALTANITANGPTTFCDGGSVVLTAPAGTGYTYHWSTGATTRAITVTTSGSYIVTVYASGNNAVSAPTIVVASPLPYAHFQLLPDPGTPHVWVAVNQCTGNDLSYSWTWGDSSAATTGATPSHTYVDSGYYTICVSITDSLGCADSYCDSSEYLFKTANQMIQMNIVQYPLGINNIDQSTLTVKYYSGAIHFSPVIQSPSEIKLYDMSGRLVVKQSNWMGTSLAVDDNISGGVYVIAIQNNAMSISRKIPITR
ncbi:MAG: hypothetical protein JWO03_1320 [Bacteroidetes bacterium]|nr:hypothetical protein [Bacteroidota bacterium]